jgi:hypothetical protein
MPLGVFEGFQKHAFNVRFKVSVIQTVTTVHHAAYVRNISTNNEPKFSNVESKLAVRCTYTATRNIPAINCKVQSH